MTNKLYLSTIADDAAELASRHGFGLEIAEFCTAYNMDTDFMTWDARVRGEMANVERFIFHAPFNELCPAAIDPMIVEVAAKRYAQAYSLMRGYGIDIMVTHTGFMPTLYSDDWFTSKSVVFWKRFLSDKPHGFKLYLENVFEQTPGVLQEIISVVSDERLRLCFDVGHAAVFGADISIPEWVEQIIPFLGHVHLHNNAGGHDAHDALGDGAIDIARLIQMVNEMAPDVTFTIETSRAQTSVEWMQMHGFLAI